MYITKIDNIKYMSTIESLQIHKNAHKRTHTQSYTQTHPYLSLARYKCKTRRPKPVPPTRQPRYAHPCPHVPPRFSLLTYLVYTPRSTKKTYYLPTHHTHSTPPIVSTRLTSHHLTSAHHLISSHTTAIFTIYLNLNFEDFFFTLSSHLYYLCVISF